MQCVEDIYRVFKAWDKGINRLNRNVLLEMSRLRHRWGFFVLLLKLADKKTGYVSLSWRELAAITGSVRKNIYTTLKDLDRAGYIKYIPAKNGHKRLITIQVIGIDKYIAKRKREGALSINNRSVDLLDIQRDFLKYNTKYREEITRHIRKLFKERFDLDVQEEILYGRPSSLLERFMVDDVVRAIKENGWKDSENPIGDLIRELECVGV